VLNSSVLRWRRNVVSDGTLLNVDGRVFQARAAAAENALLQYVVSSVCKCMCICVFVLDIELLALLAY